MSGAAAHAGHDPAPAAPPLRRRKSVYALSPGQLDALRRAFDAVYRIGDNRGFAFHAGIHGVPGQFCRHHEPPSQLPLFLPWHRAYLYGFERALRDQVQDAALPWWDWTTPSAHQSGIPPAFAAARVGGRRNPLAAGPIAPMAQGNRAAPMTERQPGDPSDLPAAADVQALLAIRDFQRFSSRLQDVHDSVHGWVGGHMGIIAWAAYDPIFWAHHTMIDRIWALWQLQNQPVFPPEYLNQALPPFPFTVAQTLNIKNLGYDYAASTAHVVVGSGH
jgi:tyrosinase